MRALILAIAIALSPAAALAQQTSGDDKPQLWGESDRGEDKGRVHATGSSYNLTQIAYAAVVVALMGGFLVWLIRRHRE